MKSRGVGVFFFFFFLKRAVPHAISTLPIGEDENPLQATDYCSLVLPVGLCSTDWIRILFFHLQYILLSTSTSTHQLPYLISTY